MTSREKGIASGAVHAAGGGCSDREEAMESYLLDYQEVMEIDHNSAHALEYRIGWGDGFNLIAGHISNEYNMMKHLIPHVLSLN